MIMSEMCFRGKKKTSQKQAAHSFLGLAIGCEKQTELSRPSCKIITLLLRSDGENILFRGVKGVGGEPLDQ